VEYPVEIKVPPPIPQVRQLGTVSTERQSVFLTDIPSAVEYPVDIKVPPPILQVRQVGTVSTESGVAVCQLGFHTNIVLAMFMFERRRLFTCSGVRGEGFLFAGALEKEQSRSLVQRSNPTACLDLLSKT
jgi:hypothetical protein